jgi:hypothetical protein
MSGRVRPQQRSVCLADVGVALRPERMERLSCGLSSDPRQRSHYKMRFAVYGLLFAAVVFLISGGHVLFLPLFFLLPLGGLFGHRRRQRRL